MAETYSGEFYCVKCKAKREASGEVHVNDKGTRMAKATCPVCGTNLNRILGKAEFEHRYAPRPGPRQPGTPGKSFAPRRARP
jgi:hypothetical protein